MVAIPRKVAPLRHVGASIRARLRLQVAVRRTCVKMHPCAANRQPTIRCRVMTFQRDVAFCGKEPRAVCRRHRTDRQSACARLGDLSAAVQGAHAPTPAVRHTNVDARVFRKDGAKRRLGGLRCRIQRDERLSPAGS